MFDAFLAKASELRSAELPFAMAIVVNHESPVSAKPGDKAIIQSDGTVWGWIGGGCVQPLIVREALKAIEEGNPRLVRIAPSENREKEAGTISYSMSCHGGGSLVVYVEPVLPKRKLLIFGRSPAAQSLSKLGQTIGYAVAVVAPEADREKFPGADFVGPEFHGAGMGGTSEPYVVVATQGEQDEAALERALCTNARYISFIASRAKAQKVMALLSQKGLPWETLRRIKAPAGLDIGTSAPEEIAVSIVAEIIQAQRGGAAQPGPQKRSQKEAFGEAFTDPVCGMNVDPGDSSLKSEYDGSLFYFCGTGCKQAFDKNPEKYRIVLFQESASNDPETAKSLSSQGRDRSADGVPSP
jgi:xanthine dehydrogenase accessory factor